MSDVTKSLLSTYKTKRLSGEIMHGKRKAEASTVKKELGFLRQVFYHAANEWEDDWDGYFSNYTNPVSRIMKGLRDNERIRYVMDDEAKRLALVLPAWLGDIVITAAGTGLRRGKVVALQKVQADFASGWINIPPITGRGKKVAPVKMTSDVRETLMRVIASSKPDCPHIFADGNGKPFSPNQVSVAFGRACRAAGIKDLRFHDLRHDFATLLINHGASLYQVQHQLGHSDPRVSSRYAHLLPENQNVVERIDGMGTTTILRQSQKKELRETGSS